MASIFVFSNENIFQPAINVAFMCVVFVFCFFVIHLGWNLFAVLVFSEGRVYWSAKFYESEFDIV